MLARALRCTEHTASSVIVTIVNGMLFNVAKRQPTFDKPSTLLLITELIVPLKPNVIRMVVLVSSLLLFPLDLATSSRRGVETKNRLNVT